MDQRLGFHSYQTTESSENATHLTAKVNLTSTSLTPVKPFGDKKNVNGVDKNLKSAFKAKLNIQSSPESEVREEKEAELQFDFDDLDFHESQACYCCAGGLKNDEGMFGSSLAPTLDFLENLDEQVTKSFLYEKEVIVSPVLRSSIILPSLDQSQPQFNFSPIPKLDERNKFMIFSSPRFDGNGDLLPPVISGGYESDSDSSTLESSSVHNDTNDDILEVPKWDDSFNEEEFGDKDESKKANSSVCGGW